MAEKEWKEFLRLNAKYVELLRKRVEGFNIYENTTV